MKIQKTESKNILSINYSGPDKDDPLKWKIERDYDGVIKIHDEFRRIVFIEPKDIPGFFEAISIISKEIQDESI